MSHLFSFLRSRFPEVKELFTGNPLSLETAFLSSIGSGITFLSFAIFFPVFANDIQDPIEELKDIIHLIIDILITSESTNFGTSTIYFIVDSWRNQC